ncbi:threonine dehydrogenase-like Zn-dependent dehydrogenase [Streptomyces sp. 2333.5]|uniref:alcohol dehydrogenase catalytic domain-containing protein n=1 Tax=unclassified Streptomyces TaxID=2593676 RepID=UPI00089B3B06|nr:MULTISPECIES: alcohol dehydrogenase catalytic domain-containing protein [unclassified Streptomyces]PJJ03377.1 threonine dehydrogenase-like Zn-dependent dehydrogenase [Streptomyces sp. 2333.5]SED45393.1 Threonine dehydrogenase [Streptomyces sp. 2314.4]SEE43065.1 Threonine dehydrogenase [Streptomyces sp. 2112.2]
MRAFVLRKVGEVGVIEKPVPEPGPNDVVVRTTAALVCTTDVHVMRGVIPVAPDVTLGHEAVGVVHALGSAVEGLVEGQRVAAAGITPCFQCDSCQRGFSSQCHGLMLGGAKFTNQRDGTLAQYFLVNNAEANLAPIPEGLSDHQALYATDMLSTGFVAAEHAELELGETVAIFAQGAVGLSATIGCRLLGAGLIIAVESIPARQELARRFGADLIVDHTRCDPVGRILELTDGQGVDAAIEALGSPETWEAAFRVTKPGGRISNVGYHGEVREPLKIPLEPFGYGMADKQVYGGFNRGGRGWLRRIFRLMETGKVDPTPMTTHEFSFGEIERAFQMMASKEGGIIKPLIHFDGGGSEDSGDDGA